MIKSIITTIFSFILAYISASIVVDILNGIIKTFTMENIHNVIFSAFLVGFISFPFVKAVIQ